MAIDTRLCAYFEVNFLKVMDREFYKLQVRQTAALIAAVLLVVAIVRAQSDPLPSWNDGASKKAIVDFVERTTKPGSAEFIPVEERVATFDNDGTLWSEQ